MSYVGTERGRNAAPLSHDVVQAHVCMHAATTLRVAELRRSLRTAVCDPSDDAESASLRALVDAVSAELHGLLEDFNAQSRAAAAMQAALRTARTRAVHLFTRLCDVQRAVPRLGGAAEPCWMPEFRLARDKVAAGTSDALVWKNLSEPQKKRVADHLGGRETFFKAVRRAPGCDRTEEEEYIT